MSDDSHARHLIQQLRQIEGDDDLPERHRKRARERREELEEDQEDHD